MTFVLDASVAASWLLPDETAPVGEASYELIARDDALVPTPLVVRSAQYARRQRAPRTAG